MLKYIFVFLCGAGLLACSSINTISVKSNTTEITSEYSVESKIDSIITHYQKDLEAEMNEVIAYAKYDYSASRPNGTFNNWVTDLVYVSQTRTIRISKPIMVLLNVGGLRNTIDKGDVTIGDIFTVMPFDNEIVWAELPMSSLKEIENYLNKSGGEPISGATLENEILSLNNTTEKAESFIVITSDYLLNGGDKMDFFQNRISDHHTGVLLRDAMISEAKLQGTLIWNDEMRIK